MQRLGLPSHFVSTFAPACVMDEMRRGSSRDDREISMAFDSGV